MRKFIIAAAVCAVIMGCEKNTGKEEDSVDIPLTITVSDNGFSMEDGTYSNSRAFSAGDRIGLFALMNGEILEGFNNICLTASGTSDAIVWQAADSDGDAVSLRSRVLCLLALSGDLACIRRPYGI